MTFECLALGCLKQEPGQTWYTAFPLNLLFNLLVKPWAFDENIVFGENRDFGESVVFGENMNLGDNMFF